MSIDHVDEAVEAERLRHVRALIEELLREADVCAHVVLVGRAGRFESFMHFVASWSNIVIERHRKGDAIRMRSKLADYGGDVEKATQHRAWSVGMVSGLGLALGQAAMGLIHASELFDKVTGAEHTPLRRDDPRDEP